MGAWGEESCSNDSCWDALGFGGIEDIHDMNQKDIEPALKRIWAGEGRYKPDACDKLGCVIWFLRAGLKVPDKYLEDSLLLVDECLKNMANEGWCDSKARKKALEEERKDIETAIAGDGSIPEKHIPGLMEKIGDFLGGEEES